MQQIVTSLLSVFHPLPMQGSLEKWGLWEEKYVCSVVYTTIFHTAAQGICSHTLPLVLSMGSCAFSHWLLMLRCVRLFMFHWGSAFLPQPEDGDKEQRAEGAAAASQKAPGCHVVPELIWFNPQPDPFHHRGGYGGWGWCHGAIR